MALVALSGDPGVCSNEDEAYFSGLNLLFLNGVFLGPRLLRHRFLTPGPGRSYLLRRGVGGVVPVAVFR